MAGKVGLVTGLRDVSLKGVPVVMVDSEDAFRELKGDMGVVTNEFAGMPGVRLARVDTGLPRVQAVAYVLAPPYPPVVFEVVNELVLFGARRMVVVTVGYRVKRSSPPPQVGAVISTMAIGLDSVSPRLAPEKLPLTASEELVSVVKRSKPGLFMGYTVTVDSARLVAGDPVVQDYIKARQVVAVDTVSAPIYALSYIYPALEAVTVVVLSKMWSQASEPLEDWRREAPLREAGEAEVEIVKSILFSLSREGEEVE